MKMKKTDEYFLNLAIEEAIKGARNLGGPFGALIVLNGEVIASGYNTVTRVHDPTAHAEINVIRETAARLNTHDLSGTVLYTSCEPCPMCLSAAYWAHIDRIVYAATRHDAANAGFIDEDLYRELALPKGQRKINHAQINMKDALRPFREWNENPEKISY